MTLNDDVVSAIEKNVLSSPASYPYLKTITKTILASTGLQSLKQENFFSKEPIRRLAICLNTNEAFLGIKQHNPFHFRKFSLEQICIYRNGLPLADSPINTTDEKLLYFNTMSDLAYIDNSPGIKLSWLSTRAILLWCLISLALTNRRMILFTLNTPILQISIELKSSAALSSNIEVFVIVEKAKTIFIDSARKFSKNHILTN